MAESSPVIGQFRQTFNFSSTNSSHSVVASALSRDPSSPATPPPSSQKLHPLTFDPLQGLIHEMALSAVIQKHTAISLPSSITNSSSPAANSTLPTTYVQNIVVQPPPHTPSPSTPSPDSQYHSTPSLAQTHNLIAVTSASSAANATKANSTMNPMPFLAQGGAPLYGTPIALQQFGAAAGQEVAVSASAGTPIVQLAPVGYAATPTATGGQGDNRAAIYQPTAGVIR